MDPRKAVYVNNSVNAKWVVIMQQIIRRGELFMEYSE